MLLELRVENYAVIDRAVAIFGRGLNLLTGETGAGKSILIDALALLLGGKASSDFVRHGAEKAVVGCVFEMTPGAREILEEYGIDVDADEGLVLLRREITAAGKGRVFINNQPATVAALRHLAPELALVHTQGETWGAFDEGQQRMLLDRFGAVRTDAVGEAFSAWRETTGRLREMETDEQNRLRMADLWRFQSAEILGSGLTDADEDKKLEAEKRILGNAEKLYTAAMRAHELLYEGEVSAESLLGGALKQIEELSRFEERFVGAVGQMRAAMGIVEDVKAEVRGFADGLQASPDRVDEIEERLEVLDRLKRKYGKTLGEVIVFGKEAMGRLAEVENRDALFGELKARLAGDTARYFAEAEAVTAVRVVAAKRLGRMAEGQINDLAMKARFEVRVTAWRETDGWTAHGWDVVDCLLAANAGEPMKALEEIASGGEMSRVMLALKVTVEEEASAGKRAKKMALPRTLVFDEIDIGIGGRAAEAVGQKLKRLSEGQQVLCITHLPQIAAFADQHFLIAKSEKSGRTQTEVLRMEEAERVREVARMLSGAKLTETSLKHAESLIETSR